MILLAAKQENEMNDMILTICKFFKLPISGGRYSKSLSPKYKALRLSVNNTNNFKNNTYNFMQLKSK